MAVQHISLLPESVYMYGTGSQHNAMASDHSKHNQHHLLRPTLVRPAVAQNQTQPPHCRPDMSVLHHQDGSTPHLTAARVCIHVWDRQPAHCHAIRGLNTHPAPPQMDSQCCPGCGCGSKSDPAASLPPRHECAAPPGWQHTTSHCCQSLYTCLGETAITFPWHHRTHTTPSTASD